MTELRIAFRALARTPVVSLVVILSLALGVGANTAIFSVMHQTLLRSLPVEDPDALVTLSSPEDFKGGRSSTDNSGGMEAIFSYPMFRGLESDARGLSGLAAYRLLGANLAFQGKTRSGSVSVVSGGYFPVLGVKPELGRLLSYEDDRGAGQAAAVLSYGYWQDRLGGRQDVLNQPLRVNGQIFTVVGVASREFLGLTRGDEPDVYVPLVFKPVMTPGWNGTDRWDDYYLYVFGRLKAGQTREAAEAALNGTYHGLVERQMAAKAFFVGKEREAQVLASRLKLGEGGHGFSQTRDTAQSAMTLLLICTALVLLIAAANAANLLLARAAQRARELAIRVAMGASAGRIVRQLMTEAALLASAGGLAGLLTGVWILDLLIAAMGDGETATRAVTSRLDGPVLLYTLGVVVATGLIFGLYPAWSAARASLASTMKDESGNASATRGGVRMRKALVTAQVALSVLLLIPTGLLLKSLTNIMRVDLGLKTEHVLGFGISPELNGYQPARSGVLFEQAEERLRAIPGVDGVTAAVIPLIAGSNWGTDIEVEGHKAGRDGDSNARFNLVGPGFFAQVGAPLIAGREFTEADRRGAAKVAVVNEAWVKHFAGGRNPLGMRMRTSGAKSWDTEIVGVVRNTKYSSVKQETPKLFFRPYRQEEAVGTMHFYVRSKMPPEQLARQVRLVMAGLDADLPLENLRTLNEQVRRSVREDRMMLALAASFAALATLLAMLGLYGVTAHGVARRTREIGIRMALGAERRQIGALVFREVLLMLAAGAAIGVPGALALARLAESQLFGVKAFDPLVAAGAVGALALAAAVAGWLPARRAARTNPIVALRYE